MKVTKYSFLILWLFIFTSNSFSQMKNLDHFKLSIDNEITKVEQTVVDWRRDFHQNPELSNQEYRTAKIVADHLKSLGMEVKTEVAKTGVVGILTGGRPGPVVALRADMDALPVTEEVDLPFASKVRTTYNGQDVGVMHACGHDVHTSVLMGVAQILANLKDKLPGIVKFIFQPAEEGAFNEECWGAELMIREGVLEKPKPDAIFGMHIWPLPVGDIGYRAGAFMASVDDFKIFVEGKGTHGALPWQGVDPIVTAAQIVMGLQTIVSRNVALNEGGAVVTVGSIHGGSRNNIISDDVEMIGTIRTHNEKARETIHKKIVEMASNIALANGAKAQVIIDKLYPSTVNHPDLTQQMISVLKEAALNGKNVREIYPVMPAEDFSYYQKEIPGMYFFLGYLPTDTAPNEIEANHSPRFFVDEKSIPAGMRALSYLTVDYLFKNSE